MFPFAYPSPTNNDSVGFLDPYLPTAAFSASRYLITTWVGNNKYTVVSGVDSFKDQTGHNLPLEQSGSSNQPLITTAGPNNKTCLDFDGVDSFLAGPNILSDYITNSAGYMIISFIADTITLNSASPHVNHKLIGDQGGYAGMFLKDDGTPKSGYAYNDGVSANVAPSLPAGNVSVATPYVMEWRHEGGNLYCRINAGSWSAATASTNTDTMTFAMQMGGGSILAKFDGQIFECATWKSIPSSGNQDIIAAGFKSWIGA